MQNNIIKNLLNLKEVLIKKTNNFDEKIEIHIELPVKEHVCPVCGKLTNKIKDYRFQEILDIPMYFKPTYLVLRKRRYQCNNYGKSFYEHNNLINKFARKSKRLVKYIVNELRSSNSIKNISSKLNISSNYVHRLVPFFAVTNTTLPEVLCIDEFKGNAGNYKYQVALLDGITHKLIDIVECRRKHFLCEYFRKYSQEELNKVKYVVSDLWKTYQDISFTYFKKAIFIADRFHYIRYACQAVDICRKNVQSKLPQKERIYFKHARKLLLSRRCNLKKEEQLTELSYILTNYSEDLRLAYNQKELLLDIVHSSDTISIREKQLSEWIKNNLESHVEAIYNCTKTFSNWYQPIKNSLKVPYTNGPIEGFNNKIKVLKRVCYGIKNFTNLKERLFLLE